MGAKNVSACYAMWGQLPHGAFRLLAGMALQALDDEGRNGQPAMTWFGGEDALIELFGRSRSSCYDALGTLKKAGAIKQVEGGRYGHRAVFKLALEVSPKGPGFRTQEGAE